MINEWTKVGNVTFRKTVYQFDDEEDPQDDRECAKAIEAQAPT